MYACVGRSIVCTCVLGTGMCILASQCSYTLHTTHLYTMLLPNTHVHVHTMLIPNTHVHVHTMLIPNTHVLISLFVPAQAGSSRTSILGYPTTIPLTAEHTHAHVRGWLTLSGTCTYRCSVAHHAHVQTQTVDMQVTFSLQCASSS